MLSKVPEWLVQKILLAQTPHQVAEIVLDEFRRLGLYVRTPELLAPLETFTWDELEIVYLMRILTVAEGCPMKAARISKIGHATIYRRIAVLDLNDFVQDLRNKSAINKRTGERYDK